MRWRLKITESDFETLRELTLAHLPLESGAFALAGVSEHGEYTDILVRRVVEVPKHLFTVQHQLRLDISPAAINGLISLCEINGLGAVLCHSHAIMSPYSRLDDEGERRIFDVLRQFTPAHMPMASLLFAPNGVTGRVWRGSYDNPTPLDEIVVIGRSIRRIACNRAPTERPQQPSDMYDRQVRAFGEEGQRLISQTKVGIVGVGGTGSPSAEQLVRMGVQDLVLIDPDVFDKSNLTRVYGTYFSDIPKDIDSSVTRHKVDIVGQHLRKINPKLHLLTVISHVARHSAAQTLLDRDIIFLCTDDHWGRSIGNQIAYQYLIPTINTGARIGSQAGTINAVIGVIDVLRPDKPCLWCSQFLSASRISTESMPADDRLIREQQQYVEDISTPTPSVINLTTTVSGLAVTAFLQLVTDFMGEKGSLARLNYSALEPDLRRGTVTTPQACVCKKVRGFGRLMPLPTI